MDLTHGGRTINDMEKFDNPNSDDDQVNEKIELKIKLTEELKTEFLVRYYQSMYEYKYRGFHIKGTWRVH